MTTMETQGLAKIEAMPEATKGEGVETTGSLTQSLCDLLRRELTDIGRRIQHDVREELRRSLKERPSHEYESVKEHGDSIHSTLRDSAQSKLDQVDSTSRKVAPHVEEDSNHPGAPSKAKQVKWRDLDSRSPLPLKDAAPQEASFWASSIRSVESQESPKSLESPKAKSQDVDVEGLQVAPVRQSSSREVGTFCVGEFNSSTDRSGRGVQRWADGAWYEGEFLHGEKHGEGTFKRKSGQVSYKGQFVKDKMHGEGTYYFTDGRVYRGQWQDGQTNGEGEMEWQDGGKYTGGFVDGKRHGEGCLEWANGRIYRGQWMRGLQHGSGVMTLKDGKELRSEWRHGKAILDPKGDAAPKELPYTQPPLLPGHLSPMPPTQSSSSSATAADARPAIADVTQPHPLCPVCEMRRRTEIPQSPQLQLRLPQGARGHPTRLAPLGLGPHMSLPDLPTIGPVQAWNSGAGTPPTAPAPMLMAPPPPPPLIGVARPSPPSKESSGTPPGIWTGMRGLPEALDLEKVAQLPWEARISVADEILQRNPDELADEEINKLSDMFDEDMMDIVEEEV